MKTYVGVEDTINRRLSHVVTGNRPSSDHHDVRRGSKEDNMETPSRKDQHGAVGFSAGNSSEGKGNLLKKRY